MQRYTTSKLANILTAYELDRRLRTAGVSTPGAPLTSNAFNPGLMPGTGLDRDDHHGPLQRVVWNTVLPVLRVLPVIPTPKRSGRDLAQLITDPDVEDVSGAYFGFGGHGLTGSSRASYDTELAQTLWTESAELVGLSTSDTPLSLRKTDDAATRQ